MFAGILLLGIIIGLICIVAGIRAESAAQRTLRRRGAPLRPSRHTPQDAVHTSTDIYPSVLFHAQALGAAHSIESGSHSSSPSAHDCPCDPSSGCHDSGGSGSCDSGGGGGGGPCGCD